MVNQEENTDLKSLMLTDKANMTNSPASESIIEVNMALFGV